MQYWDAVLSCATRMLFSWDAALGCSTRCSTGILYWDAIVGYHAKMPYWDAVESCSRSGDFYLQETPSKGPGWDSDSWKMEARDFLPPHRHNHHAAAVASPGKSPGSAALTFRARRKPSRCTSQGFNKALPAGEQSIFFLIFPRGVKQRLKEISFERKVMLGTPKCSGDKWHWDVPPPALPMGETGDLFRGGGQSHGLEFRGY